MASHDKLGETYGAPTPDACKADTAGASIGSGAHGIGLGYKEPSQQVIFVYRNWKGQIRERRVVPLEIVFGHDNYHRTDQWLMHAIDMDKGVRRTFAFHHMLTPPRGLL